jgi:hypothetical protein
MCLHSLEKEAKIGDVREDDSDENYHNFAGISQG